MAFVFKKSLISKLKNIATIASVRTANLTRVRITMASPVQSRGGVLLPCFEANSAHENETKIVKITHSGRSMRWSIFRKGLLTKWDPQMALSISIKIGLIWEKTPKLPEVLAYLSIGTDLSLWAIKLGDRPWWVKALCWIFNHYHLKSSDAPCEVFIHKISKLKCRFLFTF